MRKLVLKIIGVILICIILSQASVTFAVSSQETKLRNEQNEINNDKKEAESNLKEVQAQKSETVKQVEELTNQISDYQTQINTLDSQISNLNTKISEAEGQLKKAQEDYTKQEELLNERLVTTYEAGETSYLDFLLSSESITDLISNYFLVSEVATSDTELLDKIQKQKEEIQEAKESLETSKKELATSKASKQSISTQLQTAKKEKDAQVEKLSSDEKQIQQHIEELQSASSQIEKEIQVAQAQYAAQLEALRKKQEQEAAAKAKKSSSTNSGGTSTGSGSSSGESYTSGGSGSLQRPVSSGTITAGMYYPSGRYHGAIDYGIPVGTPVYAAADGVVMKIANLTSSYGTYVVIRHTNGLETWYAHGTSGSICVSPGQTVTRGQRIMSSGNTGNSTGPHLHFEVRVAPYGYGNRVNPTQYF